MRVMMLVAGAVVALSMGHEMIVAKNATWQQAEAARMADEEEGIDWKKAVDLAVVAGREFNRQKGGQGTGIEMGNTVQQTGFGLGGVADLVEGWQAKATNILSF